MSEEDKDDEYSYEGPEEGESEFEFLKRLSSPELQWRHLFNKLIMHVETNEKRIEAYDEESRQRDERIESKIEFIVGQQAQFAADMQQSRADQEARWKKADARWAETEKGIRGLLAIAEIHAQEIAALAEAQAASQERTDRQHAETGERVDALVNTVERLISERRNGGANESGGGAGGLRR